MLEGSIRNALLDSDRRRPADHDGATRPACSQHWGVTVINEQTVYRVPGNSHTSRHASVELLYCEKTGECQSKPDAIRRLNWATYTIDNDGKNRYVRDDIWLTDGYADYIRHYLHAMASAPRIVSGASSLARFRAFEPQPRHVETIHERIEHPANVVLRN